VGLDPKSIKILRELFKEYVRRGHTILMSTHTLDAAEALCDRIAIIAGGKIAACGTMDELRAGAENRGGLEEIFMRLTGQTAARDLVDVLDA
jgi:ABC-2 type transport system ATP-binding protein